MSRNDVILWIDIETSGSSDNAAILEYGVVLTDTTPELKEISRLTSPVGFYANIRLESEVVVDMHTKSGLLEALKNTNNPTWQEAGRDILGWLVLHTGKSNEHIPLGGSGVGHFDYKFIKRDWPILASKLTYWVLDIGVICRMLRLVNIDVPERPNKTHRALADIIDHVQEAREYLQLFERIKANGPE